MFVFSKRHSTQKEARLHNSETLFICSFIVCVFFMSIQINRKHKKRTRRLLEESHERRNMINCKLSVSCHEASSAKETFSLHERVQ